MAEKYTLTRFDGSAVWSTLSPKAQADLGSTLLDFLAARRLEESFDPDSPNGATLSRIISAHDPETIAEVNVRKGMKMPRARALAQAWWMKTRKKRAE